MTGISEPSPMTPTDDLEAAAQAATEADWERCNNHGKGHGERNAAFLAARAEFQALASPDRILALIARERALTEALAGLIGEVERYRTPGDGDWACAECRPESGSLVPDFRCHYHASLALNSEVSHD